MDNWYIENNDKEDVTPGTVKEIATNENLISYDSMTMMLVTAHGREVKKTTWVATVPSPSPKQQTRSSSIR